VKRPYILIGGTSEPGGLQVHTADVARALAADGHTVRILCTSIDHFSPLLAGAPVRVEPVLPRREVENRISYWRSKLRGSREAVAVLCRGKLGEGSLSDLFGIWSAVHRIITIEHRDFDRPWARRQSPRLYGLGMRMLVARTIVVSPHIAETMTDELRIPPDRISTCLNWVDSRFREASHEQRVAARLSLGIAPDDLVIGYHGRLAPEKRVNVLLEAFAALAGTNHRLKLVLLGDGWKREELTRQVEGLGVCGRVVFAGWQSDPSPFLPAFDIGVLPSLFEGFSLGLMEMMATGLPVLAHPMPSALILIENGRNGYLSDLGSAGSFAEALRAVIGLTASQREAIGSQAAKAIADGYTKDRRLGAVLKALRAPDDGLAERP
jgi:glycosyltransferase involved in cell wall biosynthesis